MKERILKLWRKIRLKMSSPKIFYVILAEEQTSSYEDPQSPWDWQGSGCYDISIYAWKYTYYAVCARDTTEARELMYKNFEEEYEKNFKSELKRCQEHNYSNPEIRARQYTEDNCHRNMDIIGILQSTDNTGMDPFEVIEVDSAQTEWAHIETVPNLYDATYELKIYNTL